MDSSDAIKHIAVAGHPKVAEAAREAGEVAEYLRQCGRQAFSTSINSDDLEQRIAAGEVDLLITVGGDGTVLRAGHLCAPYDVPILAINRGRFGFLIEVPHEHWRDVLPSLLSGEYWFERRMMLRAEQWRDDQKLGQWEVLNEALIGRGETVRPVHLVTSLDGDYVTTYVADGLIVSTSTGSTAYALAAGGPILPPELRNMLVVPVAPHLSVDRAIVLPEGATVSVTIRTGHQALLSIDGHPSIQLLDNDRVDVCASKYNVRFLRFQDPSYFYLQLFHFMDQNPSAGDAQ